jgi:hypothetical protein
MKRRKITLLVVALAMLALMATACNKTDSSANVNVNSSPGKNSSSSPGTASTASTASNRFVGTWTEEGEKNDKGTKFTEDGKIIEVSSEKQVGTYAASGNDKATITIAEGGSGTATLESDNRMLLEAAGEKTYLIRK